MMTSMSDPTDASGDALKKDSQRPKYSRFTQQELPACKPILTPRLVICIFILMGIVFIPIGVASLLASQNVVEIVKRYENRCLPKNMTVADKVAYLQNPLVSKRCTKNIKIPKTMRQPIYVYYQLDNFYQNHRRYVQSRNNDQLRDPSKADVTKNCDPEKLALNGSPIVPCGLIAWSLFNDTYSFTRGRVPLTVNRKGISWKSDRDYKFGRNVYPKNFQSGALIGGGQLDVTKPLSEQEDLIVWMRTAALPTFRKMYGKIETDLNENDKIKVILENNYNTYSFGGTKKIVLSTTSWLGGKNDVLGIVYLGIGGFSLFLAAGFTVLHFLKPRELGDTSYLSWNKNS